MKQLRISLSADEIKSTLLAIDSQVIRLKKDIDTLTMADSVRVIVEDEVTSLKKTAYYLSEVLDAENKGVSK